MKQVGPEKKDVASGSDVNRYRQAIDVAYNYLKNKKQQEQVPQA